jgi:hypothetical protein
MTMEKIRKEDGVPYARVLEYERTMNMVRKPEVEDIKILGYKQFKPIVA